MGYVLQPHCLACERQWPNVTVGNAKNFVFVCVSCNNIVNPTRDGFRYRIRPCPECNAPLAIDDQVDMLEMQVDYAGTTPSGVKCPRCVDGDISFRTKLHFSKALSDRAPKPGEMVHGSLRDGVLKVPGMFLCSGVQPTVKGLPADIGDRLMELRTISVEPNKDENIGAIEFEFIRILGK